MKLWKRICTGMMALLLLTGTVVASPGTLTVKAEEEVQSENRMAASSGIKNNGTGGISININSAPYTTFQGYSYGEYAYTSSGCAWFASARTNQLTGKGNVIRAGTNWWNGGNGREGFSTGQTPAAPALICWTNHVAVLEKIEGNTAYISEGGTGASDQAHGYCLISATSVSAISSRNSGFLGYVYLGSTNTGSLSISARSSYYTDEDVVVSWNTPANTVKYGFTLRYNPTNGNDIIDKYVTGNSYNLGKLGAGNYRLWMRPYNASGVGGTAVYVDFGVTTRPVTKVTGITLNKTSLSLQKGQSASLTATVAPSNATNKNVTWSSSNTGVATVSNGNVKAIAAGTATITVTAADGSGKKAACTVKVSNPHTHSYTAKVTKAATCTAEGVRTYTCSCGASYTEKIAKTAHKAVTDNAVSATCTRDGKTEGSHCAVCGTVLKAQQRIPAAGHKAVTDNAVSATCTREGKTQGIHCSVCGTVLKAQQKIPATGHKYSFISTVTATPDCDGAIKKTCGICGVSTKTIIYQPQTVSVPALVYNGKSQEPKVIVTDRNGGVIAASNYKLTYKNNKAVGLATVTIQFNGNYSGLMKKQFAIKPNKTKITSVKAKSKAFEVKWKKQTSQTTGYEIQYSTNKNFKGKAAVTVDIRKNSVQSKKICKLKAKRTYYVRVRTYKTVKVNGRNTKVYSDWSDVKKVVTKK